MNNRFWSSCVIPGGGGWLQHSPTELLRFPEPLVQSVKNSGIGRIVVSISTLPHLSTKWLRLTTDPCLQMKKAEAAIKEAAAEGKKTTKLEAQRDTLAGQLAKLKARDTLPPHPLPDPGKASHNSTFL